MMNQPKKMPDQKEVKSEFDLEQGDIPHFVRDDSNADLIKRD
jgi:hypothetical protein